jgi:uncharacterized protein DUF3551
MEDAMPRALFALLVVAAASALAPVGASAGESAFCIKGCDFGAGRGDCSFTSYQQCLATASGRDATCDANPYYNAHAEMQPNRSRMSKRKL